MAEPDAIADADVSCASCLAFHPDDASRATGECRRNAPRPDAVAKANTALLIAWPNVDGENWCARHRQAVAPFDLTFLPSVEAPSAKDGDAE